MPKCADLQIIRYDFVQINFILAIKMCESS